jgi:hypothetical protein
MPLDFSERERSLDDARLGLYQDPVSAHLFLFAHRHAALTPDFHVEMIEAFHSSSPRVLLMAFRGAAKSTIAEETIITEALLRRFHNCVIIGETEQRAQERLASCKRELETNPAIESLFGAMVGPVWGATKIELSNGVVIQAAGRGQSLRGLKHLDHRPDFVFCDDLEDEESVLTEEQRRKTSDWFWRTLIPSLDNPDSPLRVAATPLHEEALAMSLARLDEFQTHTVPIESLSPQGERLPSWPAKFPLEVIDKMKESFLRAGKIDAYMQEYMCQTSDPARRIFTHAMFVYEPTRVRTYEPVYAVYDPARTVSASSATTGKIVASWVANRLIVWQASARLWRPDEIIADMFAVDDQFAPIAIGVEEDGLNEFIMQPLRHAQLERGHPLPLRPLKAPRGKLDFIRSLQPFFKAREVIFAGEPEDFAELTTQLLNFGASASAKIDAPNALAYFLKLRPGKLVYEDFGPDNIMEEVYVNRSPVFLAVNSDGRHTAGVVCQVAQGVLAILADDLREGDPGDTLADLVGDARQYANQAGFGLKLYAPRSHFSGYDTIGLRAAAAKIPVAVYAGGSEAVGRDEIRSFAQKRTRGFPALRISSSARWTLRAFTGGYCRALGKDGTLGNEPQPGAYQTLMQGLEALMAMRSGSLFDDDDLDLKYDWTKDGRRFITART